MAFFANPMNACALAFRLALKSPLAADEDASQPHTRECVVGRRRKHFLQQRFGGRDAIAAVVGRKVSPDEHIDERQADHRLDICRVEREGVQENAPGLIHEFARL